MTASKSLLRGPEGRPDYIYDLTENGFQLCAEFKYSSKNNSNYYREPIINDSDNLTIINPDNWQHEGGKVCFERVVK